MKIYRKITLLLLLICIGCSTTTPQNSAQSIEAHHQNKVAEFLDTFIPFNEVFVTINSRTNEIETVTIVVSDLKRNPWYDSNEKESEENPQFMNADWIVPKSNSPSIPEQVAHLLNISKDKIMIRQVPKNVFPE